MQPIIFDLPSDRRLTGVQREVRAKGHVWVAEDVRMQWLILSQRSSHLQIAIEKLCNDTVSLTSLSESACLQLRKGRTKGWQVHRLEPDQLIKYVDERRTKYQKVVIAADYPRKWLLEAR